MLTLLARRLFLGSAACIVGMLAVSIWAYATLPENASIAIHFSGAFKPDAYAGKGALLGLPAMAAGGCCMCLLLAKAQPAHGITQIGVSLALASLVLDSLLAVIQLVVIWIAMGGQMNDSRLPSISHSLVGVLFGLSICALAPGLSKIPRNNIFGIRTPWTLASNQVWRRTHAHGAKLMLALGMSTCVVSVVSSTYSALWFIVGSLCVVVWSVIYSRKIAAHESSDE